MIISLWMNNEAMKKKKYIYDGGHWIRTCRRVTKTIAHLYYFICIDKIFYITYFLRYTKHFINYFWHPTYWIFWTFSVGLRYFSSSRRPLQPNQQWSPHKMVCIECLPYIFVFNKTGRNIFTELINLTLPYK